MTWEEKKEIIKAIKEHCYFSNLVPVAKEALDKVIKALEQEPKTGHCKDCKYFEYDSVAKVDGIPLIVAH